MAEDFREMASLMDAIALLDEWRVAYEELRLEHVRLMHRYVKLQRSLEHANSALENWEVIATFKPNSTKRVSAFDR